MTTEEDWNKLLDENPADFDSRRIFGDWLEERGDPRADGYRALGVLRKHPLQCRSELEHHRFIKGKWFFHVGRYGHIEPGDLKVIYPYMAEEVNELPADWMVAAVVSRFMRNKSPSVADKNNELWMGYTALRSGAEDMAALAFAELPFNRRQQLLAGVVSQSS